MLQNSNMENQGIVFQGKQNFIEICTLQTKLRRSLSGEWGGGWFSMFDFNCLLYFLLDACWSSSPVIWCSCDPVYPLSCLPVAYILAEYKIVRDTTYIERPLWYFIWGKEDSAKLLIMVIMLMLLSYQWCTIRMLRSARSFISFQLFTLIFTMTHFKNPVVTWEIFY